jgi:hypothetical protein
MTMSRQHPEEIPYPKLYLPASVVLLALLFVASPILGNSQMSRRDSLKVQTELILPDSIKLNEPFDITFNVLILDSVRHDNGTPDEIDLLLPDECKILAGESSWRGTLEYGSKVSLQIKASVLTPMHDYFQGMIYSGFIPDRMNLYRTSNRVDSRYFTVGNPQPLHGMIDPEPRTTDTSPAELVLQPPAPTIEPSAPEGTPRNLVSVEITMNSRTAQEALPLKAHAVNSLIFWLKNSPNDTPLRVMPHHWDMSCPLFDMALNRDSTATLLLDSKIDTATVALEIEGTRHLVRLKVTE